MRMRMMLLEEGARFDRPALRGNSSCRPSWAQPKPTIRMPRSMEVKPFQAQLPLSVRVIMRCQLSNFKEFLSIPSKHCTSRVRAFLSGAHLVTTAAWSIHSWAVAMRCISWCMLLEFATSKLRICIASKPTRVRNGKNRTLDESFCKPVENWEEASKLGIARVLQGSSEGENLA